MRQAELKLSEIPAAIDLGPCEAGRPCVDEPGKPTEMCRIHQIRWFLEGIAETHRVQPLREHYEIDLLRRAHAAELMRMRRADPRELMRKVEAA